MPRHEEGFFPAQDNLRLFWESDTPDTEPRAGVGILHGFADHIGRYRAVRGALLTAGFAVFGLDMRGHGQSDGKRGHVDAFSEYVDDLERFFARMKDAAKGKPLFFLAHSNGALVALLYFARKPAGLTGAVLSSPFLELAFKPPVVKVMAAKVMNHVLPSVVMGNELDVVQLSRDVAWQESTARDPLYHHVVSSRWFVEAGRAQERVRASGGSVTLPLLVLTGGEDRIAAAPVTLSFFESLASGDKQYKQYPGMRHELLNELGKEEVFGDVVRWISAHS